jgi:DNA-binding NarL/FixJ family response regulator
MTAIDSLAVDRDVPVRLAILDDHELLLDSLSSWIAGNATDFTVVVAAATWLDLVRSPHFPPELVILDFQLREPVSIEARVRTCRAAGAKVIVLSGMDTEESRTRALQAGASAYLVKSLPMVDVMNVARGIMGRERSSSQSGGRVVQATNTGLPRPKLSRGETEALKLYVSGLSTAEVASRMGVQYETAKTYLRRVREKYSKVGRPASRKTELIRRAAEDGHLE